MSALYIFDGGGNPVYSKEKKCYGWKCKFKERFLFQWAEGMGSPLKSFLVKAGSVRHCQINKVQRRTNGLELTFEISNSRDKAVSHNKCEISSVLNQDCEEATSELSISWSTTLMNVQVTSVSFPEE